MKKTLFRKLNFLIAIASIFAALVVGGCANLLSSTSSDDDSAPVNVVYPAVTVENGRGIVRGTLPQETSASTRTAMPDVPTISSYKVFAQNGSTTIEANVDNANKTFSISLPYGTWNVTANGLLANNRVVYTQTQSVTVSATNPTVDLPFTSLSYSTNPDDGEGEISLTVTLDSSATSTITAIDYTLTKGEENITRQVSDTDLQAGTFKIEHTTENLGAWYLTINCFGNFSNLVYRIDETVNVYANLTTDTFVGSAPYISSGAINITQAMLTEFQQTTLYVHATDGKDTNTGTQFDPLQTFNRAVELVNNSTRPDGTEFRIFLKSDVNDGADLELKAGKKLTVANVGNNNYTITSLGRDFTVAATSELTVKDIQFQKLRFVVQGAFTMNGGTISGNEVDGYGGGIYNEGTLTINGGTISNCTAKGGGGIYNEGTLTITDSGTTISNCTANGTTSSSSGGGIYNTGTLTITDGTITDCTATKLGGGGICNTGTLNITGATISECWAHGGGGGIYNKLSASAEITGCTITNCNTDTWGGGIYNVAKATIMDCTIELCSTTAISSNTGGGGICNQSATLTISGGTIYKCTAEYCSGGGIYAYNFQGTSQLTVQGVKVLECKAKAGGGIYSTVPSAMIDSCIIIGCTATNSGGGIDEGGGTVTIKNCTIGGSGPGEGNTAAEGGGLFCVNTLTIIGGEITGNTATEFGGGIRVYKSSTTKVTLDGGEISQNTSGKKGGGIYNEASVTVNGGMIFENTATEVGGDILHRGTELTLTGTTFVKDIHIEQVTRTGKYYITADSSLALADGKTVCATISLDDSEYTAGKQVLQASSGGTITSDICGKFALTPAPDGIEWEISPDSTGAQGVLNRNSLYVRGTGAGWYTENPAYTASAGSDSNSGSKSSPFATIQKAIEKVLEMNDGTSEYTIYVDGTITGGATATANGMGDISPDKDLLLKIQSMSATTHATLDAEGSGRVLNINANATVALNNINIANGTVADKGGGINNLGTLTITGGTITGCTASSGGGIYNQGSLTITDGTISNCTATSGSGIYNDGMLTMSDGTITGNTSTNRGGGVYNNRTFTMTVGTISKNKSKYSAGVFVSSGATFTMTDGTISENISERSGAGVSIDTGGSFTMQGGTINGNTSNDGYGGGGVYNEGTFTITGGTITGNKAPNATDGGGGINNHGGTLTMSGGTITGNTAGTNGGGVYNNSSATFTMEGGTISGNSATTGKGAYIDDKGKMKMGGSARFASDNDVYLNDDTSTTAYVPTIQIASALTGTTPVATITPSVYTAGKQVLSLATGSTTTLANEYQKFAVSDENWGIDDEGKLFSDLWVSSTGDDTNGSGTKIAPFATLQRAIDEIKTLNDSTASYTIHIVGNVVGTSAIGSDVPAQKIFITGTSSSTDVLDANGAIKAILAVACTAPVELTNIKLTNGGYGGIDVKAGANVTLGADAVVSGNGSARSGAGIYISTGGTFTLNGGEISENESPSGGAGGVKSNGTFIMNSGTISRHTGTYASAAIYQSGGTFTMNGGTISHNEAPGTNGGGGVCVADNGKFEMKGGEISNNTAKIRGGGVYIADGTFTMTGGEINGNSAAEGNGGGVYVASQGTFRMAGGTISNNEASGANGLGGGVCNDGSFIMSGGTISDCTAVERGGGVYVAATRTFTMTGTAKITNCKTTSTLTTDSGGGGIYNDGTAAIWSGTISGCTAGLSGGGVCNGGTLTMTGGEISGNTAQYGAGVHLKTSTKFEMSGGEITGNTATEYGGGVYITNGTFTITAGTITGNTANTGGKAGVENLGGTFNNNGGTVQSD